MSVDALLDELAVLLTRAGISPPTPPPDVAAVDEVERAISPLRLPASARRLWERVDARSYGVDTYPALTTPEFALPGWQRDRDVGLIPAKLFPLCYSSWVYVFIELHAPKVDDGGTLFEWMYGGADFEIAYDDLDDWLAVQIQAIESGETVSAHGRLHLQVPVDQRLCDVGPNRLARRGPRPLSGTTTAIPEHDWPKGGSDLSGFARAQDGHIQLTARRDAPRPRRRPSRGFPLMPQSSSAVDRDRAAPIRPKRHC